jgi:hypothetical protein
LPGSRSFILWHTEHRRWVPWLLWVGARCVEAVRSNSSVPPRPPAQLCCPLLKARCYGEPRLQRQ